eukprot:COSAG02_NODE_16702_length_1062_cov_3.147287_1_plen_102_part_00
MDNINYVVSAVIRGCQEKNVATTEVMAAFVARARVLEAPELYHPNASMKDEDVSDLVNVRLRRASTPLIRALCAARRCASMCRSTSWLQTSNAPLVHVLAE